MTESKCVKCESIEFEMVPAQVKGTKFKHKFCRCATCGSVIGILEENSTSAGVENILNNIQNIEAKLQNMESKINQQLISLNFRK